MFHLLNFNINSIYYIILNSVPLGKAIISLNLSHYPDAFVYYNNDISALFKITAAFFKKTFLISEVIFLMTFQLVELSREKCHHMIQTVSEKPSKLMNS